MGVTYAPNRAARACTCHGVSTSIVPMYTCVPASRLTDPRVGGTPTISAPSCAPHVWASSRNAMLAGTMPSLKWSESRSQYRELSVRLNGRTGPATNGWLPKACL